MPRGDSDAVQAQRTWTASGAAAPDSVGVFRSESGSIQAFCRENNFDFLVPNVGRLHFWRGDMDQPTEPNGQGDESPSEQLGGAGPIMAPPGTASRLSRPGGDHHEPSDIGHRNREMIDSRHAGDLPSAEEGAQVDRHSPATNDATFDRHGVAPNGFDLLDALLQAADGPVDRPDETGVSRGAEAAIAAVQCEVPGAQRLADRIHACGAAHREMEVAGQTSMPDSRRIGRHLMYWLLRELSSRLDRGEPVDMVALQITGAWLILGLLSGWKPRPKILAKVRAAAVRPTGSQAKAWSARARRQTLLLALKSLEGAIAAASSRARLLGLVVRPPRPESADTSRWSRFNRMFRRRGNNLRTLSSVRATTGTLGHGTLSAGGLAAAGAQLLDGVTAGDEADLLVYLEALSHLPCETVKELPVVVRGDAPHDALAWIDLPRRRYCYRLFRLLERGAKPRLEDLDRLEVSTQIVRIGLSAPAVALLDGRAADAASDVVALKEIIRSDGHHPRATVAAGAGYRVTSRRVQETLPALLLQQGHFRWPVLLATNSPYLVSAGRDSYGLCRSDAIDRCVDAAHRAMDWPVPRSSKAVELVGSRTVPKPHAISELLNHLAASADRGWRGLADGGSAIATLRAVAPWVAANLSLMLALRTRLEYRLPAKGLSSGDRIRFNDKLGGELDPVDVPICPMLFGIWSEWMALARVAAETLTSSVDDGHRCLGRDIQMVIDDPASMIAALTVDAAGRICPVGYRTWHDAAPRRLRLPGNFGRHFWPLRLMELGIEQRLLDILMRHQLGGLDLRCSWGTSAPRRGFERLKEAIESVARGLDLDRPRHWGQL